MYHSFLVVLFCASVTLSTGTFVTSPQNVTAYAGNKAQFTCTIPLDQYDLILWLVEDNSFTSLPPEYGASTNTYLERSNLQTSVLTINASPETNGTLITCKGYSSTNRDNISRAFLSVQGQLAAPSNLAFTVDDYSVRLAWEAPFSLPGSDMEFKINVSIGGHSSSLTTPHLSQNFSYSSLNISRCDSASIEFTVRGVNPAGEGLPTPALPVNVPPDGNLCNQLPGTLGPPISLSAIVDEGFVSLEWTPPFTLSQIFYYTIEARISKDSPRVKRVRTNETSHAFLFSDLNIVNRCTSSYELTLNVCGVNFAGKGDFSNTSLTIPQSDRYCSTSASATQDHTVKTVGITTIPVPTSLLSKDITLYLGVATGALVIMFVVALTTFITCYLLKRRKRQMKTEPSDFKMDSNTCYVTAKLKRNQAYEQPPHIYEVILLPTTVDA